MAGTGFEFHSPHWHGNTVVVNGMRTDVTALMPMGMLVADMTPDDPGVWLFHCHVSNHLRMGMQMLYEVTPDERADTASEACTPSLRDPRSAQGQERHQGQPEPDAIPRKHVERAVRHEADEPPHDHQRARERHHQADRKDQRLRS